MIADRATARELLTRKLAKIDREMGSAARRSDKDNTARLGGLYEMFRDELRALDWAQRRARS